MFASMDSEPGEPPDRRTTERESRVKQTIATDATLLETTAILRSGPGIGPVASTMLIA